MIFALALAAAGTLAFGFGWWLVDSGYYSFDSSRIGSNAIPEDEDTEAFVTVQDSQVQQGMEDELSYIITDRDGIDLESLENAVEQSGTYGDISTIFEVGLYVVHSWGSEQFTDEGDPMAAEIYLEGLVADDLIPGSYEGPTIAFYDAEGTFEQVSLPLDIV